jgi:hypothetical protein
MTAVAEDVTYTGVISEMNETGDTKIRWDKDNPDEVAAARAAFDALKAKKFRSYAMNGKDRVIIHDFDPDAEQIVMAPQTVGG